jgi:hypothetical protein
VQALLRGSLCKAFGGFGLLMLGLGIVIGSGWAQLSGMAGQQYAGCAAGQRSQLAPECWYWFPCTTAVGAPAFTPSAATAASAARLPAGQLSSSATS